MPKYLFILGKNAKLAAMELAAVFKSHSIAAKITEQTDFFALVDGTIDLKLISLLGGTVKIGEVVAEISVPSSVFFKYDMPKLENKLTDGKVAALFPSAKEIGISVYPRSGEQLRRIKWKAFANFLGSYFKKAKNADFMASSRPEPWLNAVEVNKKKFVRKNFEVLFAVGDKKAYVAKTVAVYDPFEFEARDMGKAGRNLIGEIGLMPPKLARMLVNLSEVKEGETLLDPFCGTGTILCEALLCGVNTIGMDVNEKCTEVSWKNLEDVQKKYETGAMWKAVRADARKIPLSDCQMDAIVTEPYLGKLFKKPPTSMEVKKTTEELQPLYFDALKELCRVLKRGRKIIFIAPVFRIKQDNKIQRTGLHGETELYRVNMEKIVKDLGLRIIGKVLEAREKHIVMREIWVLEK